MNPARSAAPHPATGLGIDAGGTQTRWALVSATGQPLAEGEQSGMSALQLATAAGVAHVEATLHALARDVAMHGAPVRIFAGVTGTSGNNQALRRLLARAFGVAEEHAAVGSDVETAYLDLFAPGEGYVVYAGTGSIAAFIDADGVLHRAGGHGVILDDAGGGFWIAREALRQIWRAEDEQPGQWSESPLATEVFRRIGGSEWDRSREFVYGTPLSEARGEIGKLALAVAATAESDPLARRILSEAGVELARLGRSMITRFGSRPLALTGRVVQLHSIIETAMRASLPNGVTLQVRNSEPHLAAARIAAQGRYGFNESGAA